MLVGILCLGFVSCQKTTYVVGGWQAQVPGQPPQTPETIAKTLAPIFQDYLTEAVGKKLSPPAKFVFRGVDIDARTSSRDLIASGQLDFLYTLSGGIACKAAEFSWVPLAAQRNIVGTTVFGTDALVVFSRRNNSAIAKPEDMKGKTLGCGYLWSGATYLQGYQILLEHGVHIYRDMTQVRFYGPDYESYFQAVLRGELDVGFTQSSWLYKNHGQEVDGILIHDRKDGLTYEGQVYPYAVSRLTQNYGFIASNKTSWDLKRKVLDALLSLNATHPAMKLLKTAGWGSAMNFGLTLTSLEQSGVAYDASSGQKTCRDPYSRFDIYQSIACPKDHFKVDYNLSLQQCDLAGLVCPAGVICFCRPCQPRPQNVFSWETVLYLCATLYGVGAFYLGLPRLLLQIPGTSDDVGDAKALHTARADRAADEGACDLPGPVVSAGAPTRRHSPAPRRREAER